MTRALTGPTPSTNSAACCLPSEVALTSLNGTIGSGTGSTAAGADTAAGASSKAAAATGATTAAAGSSSAATASSTSVASATPPGSVPTFTLSGCATTQAMVALTLERLRLIDGVSEVTLQSSTQTPKSGSGDSSSGSGSCKGPVFAMQITFDPLPSASATSSPSTAPTETASALTPATGSPTTSTGGVR